MGDWRRRRGRSRHWLEGVYQGGGGERGGGDEGRGVGGQAVRELLGGRQETVKASSLVMEGKMSLARELGRMTDLVLEEPRLVEGRRTEDQSLVT